MAVMSKKKAPAKPPAFDFADAHRGPMTVLVDKTNKKTLVLVEWPKSLFEAHRAGVLTGRAEQEAITLKPAHRAPSHPWRQYPSAMNRSPKIAYYL